MFPYKLLQSARWRLVFQPPIDLRCGELSLRLLLDDLVAISSPAWLNDEAQAGRL
jgi:hypothetical protein